MTIRDRKQLKQTADRRLAAASYNSHKLILIHSGITLGVALLLAVCNYIIAVQIEAHSGLSGIQMRSVLETIPSVLSVVYAIAAPFWSIGLVYAAIRLARGQSAWPGSLLEGFRRSRVMIRFLLLQSLVYGIVTMAAMYAAWTLYIMFTPAGRAFAEAIGKLILSGIDYMTLLEQIPEPVMERVARGYQPFFAVCELVLMIPALYRLRLAGYMVMEKEGISPWKAIRTSGKIMRRNGFSLFLLDASYWWYYLISVVLMVPAYADILLEKLQITLPVSSAEVYLIGNAVYAVLTLIFHYLAMPKVVTTYAVAYDVLKDEYAAKQAQLQQEAQ